MMQIFPTNPFILNPPAGMQGLIVLPFLSLLIEVFVMGLALSSLFAAGCWWNLYRILRSFANDVEDTKAGQNADRLAAKFQGVKDSELFHKR